MKIYKKARTWKLCEYMYKIQLNSVYRHKERPESYFLKLARRLNKVFTSFQTIKTYDSIRYDNIDR